MQCLTPADLRRGGHGEVPSEEKRRAQSCFNLQEVSYEIDSYSNFGVCSCWVGSRARQSLDFRVCVLCC